MTFSHWLRKALNRTARKSARWASDSPSSRGRHYRLSLEALEDRTLLSTLVIDPKNLIISAAATGLTAHYDLADPASGVAFGSKVVPLPDGNIVVTDPMVNGNAGAVYLFNGGSGALISTLSGSAGDGIGSGGITVLTNGNFVITSPSWGDNAGAVTWGSGTFGVSGVVSAANSLVGSHLDDYVGHSYNDPGADVTPLTNGDYVVASPEWNGDLGAVTWGNGTTGVAGVVSAANSLVGSSPSDQVGYGVDFGLDGARGVTALTNGNYVVDSPTWSNFLGAVTWGNGTTGVTGAVSAANSLVGTIAHDYIGGFGVTALTNGNYVVQSINWNNNRGAATWGNGATGIVGAVSAANSLVGTNPTPPGVTNMGDIVGGVVTPLTNGNYIVTSSDWNGFLGAVTWGNGTSGVTGAVSPANSLVGTASDDQVGSGGVTVLTNGNFVVNSPNWNASTSAVTWANGNTGVVGPVSAANSLVGGNAGVTALGPNATVIQTVAALTNGNYVVSNPHWNSYRGAVTWANGSTGTIGNISAANSLVGTTPGGAGDPLGDVVGSDPYSPDMPGVTPLANGNYVVTSPVWNDSLGAATWGNGTTGTVGAVSAANSLVGAADSDRVGSGGVTALTNGNYVVGSPLWNGQVGAATWGNGSTGSAGTVSAANSLVGAAASDQVGASASVTALTNGNYVVATASWSGGRGSASWGSGTAGVVGTVSAANSLVGSTPNGSGGTGGDAVGSGGVTPLPNGNYVVVSPNWNSASGAATWADGTSGLTLDGQNTVDALNSLIGADPNAGLMAVVPGPVAGAFLANFTSENGGRVTVGAPVTGPLTFGLFADLTLTLSPAFLTTALNAGTNVVLEANNDITVSDPIIAAPSGAAGNLTLDAGRSIVLDASITTAGGNLSLIANDTVADGVVDADRDPGNASLDMTSGATLNTGGGALSIDVKNSADKTNNGHGAATLTNLTAPSTTLSATTTLGFALNGTTPGDGVAPLTYTQLNVTGPLSLNGNALQLTHGPTGATAGDTFTIIQTTGGVTGTFNGLAEGATVTAQDGTEFTISYLANGGDDVTLTAIMPAGFSYDATSHVLNITGTAATNTFTYFQGSAVDNSGTLQTTCDFTLNGATIAYPQGQLSQVDANGQGANSTAVLITNDTYIGSDGQTHETVETVVLGPGGGSLNKPNAAGTFQVFVLLNGFSTSYAYVGHADSATLEGTPSLVVQSIFVTAGSYSYIFGGGEFHLVSGAKYVYGYGSDTSESDPADQAWQYDAAGSLDAFVASGNAYSYMSGSDTNGNTFFNEAVGFQVTYGIATHGNAIAYLIDSPGNDVFFGATTYSYLSGTDSTGSVFNVAEAFSLVFGESFVGGTDFAYNYDPSHNILNSRWILLT